MTIRLPDAGANAALDAALDRANNGAAAGTIEVRTGSQPASANNAATGTLLATFTLADPAWAAASGRSKALDADPDLTDTADATGDPGWARIKDSDGNTVMDGSVGTSGTDFITTSGTWTSGQTVSLTTGAVSM